MLKIPWTARRTNKSVIEEITPPRILEALMFKQKLSYFGHIMCAEHERLGRSTMLGTVDGRREKGRPWMRWMDEVTAATKQYLPELREAVQDRDVWRNLIMNVTRSQTQLDGTRQQDHTFINLIVTTLW